MTRATWPQVDAYNKVYHISKIGNQAGGTTITSSGAPRTSSETVSTRHARPVRAAAVTPLAAAPSAAPATVPARAMRASPVIPDGFTPHPLPVPPPPAAHRMRTRTRNNPAEQDQPSPLNVTPPAITSAASANGECDPLKSSTWGPLWNPQLSTWKTHPPAETAIIVVHNVIRMCNCLPHVEALHSAQTRLAPLVALIQRRRLKSLDDGPLMSAEAAAIEMWGEAKSNATFLLSAPDWPSWDRLNVDHESGTRIIVARQDEAALDATTAEPSLLNDMCKLRNAVVAALGRGPNARSLSASEPNRTRSGQNTPHSPTEGTRTRRDDLTSPQSDYAPVITRDVSAD
jgi:hypothetical protein